LLAIPPEDRLRAGSYKGNGAHRAPLQNTVSAQGQKRCPAARPIRVAFVVLNGTGRPCFALFDQGAIVPAAAHSFSPSTGDPRGAPPSTPRKSSHENRSKPNGPRRTDGRRRLSFFPFRPAQLVLMFGATAVLQEPGLMAEVRDAFPGAHLLGLLHRRRDRRYAGVSDDSLVVNAIIFEHTQIRGAQVSLRDVGDSFQAGESLARALPPARRHRGAGPSRPAGARPRALGWIAGQRQRSGPRFDATSAGGDLRDWRGWPGMAPGSARRSSSGTPRPPRRPSWCSGLYGSRLHVGVGSLGGWDSFGPERLIHPLAGQCAVRIGRALRPRVVQDLSGRTRRGAAGHGPVVPLEPAGESGRGRRWCARSCRSTRRSKA